MSIEQRVIQFAEALYYSKVQNSCNDKDSFISDCLLEYTKCLQRFDKSKSHGNEESDLLSFIQQRINKIPIDFLRLHGKYTRHGNERAIEISRDHMNIDDFNNMEFQTAILPEDICTKLSIEKILAQLDYKEKTVIIEHLINDKPLDEIGKQFDLSTSRMSQILTQGRQHFIRLWKKQTNIR